MNNTVTDSGYLVKRINNLSFAFCHSVNYCLECFTVGRHSGFSLIYSAVSGLMCDSACNANTLTKTFGKNNLVVHPTRGLDIGATRFVHDQMIAARERGVGILLISADFDEVLEMSDRVLVIFEGQIMGEFSGKNPPIQEISLAMTGK